MDDLLTIPQEVLIELVHRLTLNGFEVVNSNGMITFYKGDDLVKEFSDWMAAIAFIDGYILAKDEL